MKTIHFQDLGFIDYQRCWDYQEKLLQENITIKTSNRHKNSPAEISLAAVKTSEVFSGNSGSAKCGKTSDVCLTKNHLLFCEHPHVYTLGKSGAGNNLLANSERLKELNATYIKTNRGGDITYHGPGQIVGYPILDLEQFFTDISRYMRSLEEVIILCLHDFGIEAGRLAGSTGVWIEPEKPHRARKICAMGVRTSRWVTMHGWALNVNSDLNYFNFIVPCGISDKAVTSMEKELDKKVSLDIVRLKLKFYFARVFECEII